MPQPHNDDLPPLARPSLSVDWEVYAAMLEESDLPLEQKKELVETLWSIVVMFVDLGFEVHCSDQICGEDDNGREELIEDGVSSMNNTTEPERKEDR
ncbi:MAG: hypothetical protein AAGK71_07590 [Pseudomonadota bacterium]